MGELYRHYKWNKVFDRNYDTFLAFFEVLTPLSRVSGSNPKNNVLRLLMFCTFIYDPVNDEEEEEEEGKDAIGKCCLR